MLFRNLANLTGALGMGRLDTETDAIRLPAVLDWLNRNPGWLLILDNADTLDAQAEATALLGRLTHGHVLLTSRLTRLPTGFQRLPLGVLKPEDAAEFLLQRTQDLRVPSPDDDAQARALAEELGWLVLALEHAGALIAEDHCTLAAYRDRLRRSFDAVMAWSDPVVTHYPRAIAATWKLSFDCLTPQAKELLARLA